ncbi:hypothetical protein BUALT_Bualt13G0068800 [Buddleja alternifolia]|uniref:Transposase MuDR plant domain-containing protein n=1 Tax=Buddleja alternifolia TaxID=168488 RepID=A0AAV6WSK9_9LAMI|nr:hypothetical protein BUALT_Bualt13G0068800 [Buddleja alternifolia]
MTEWRVETKKGTDEREEEIIWPFCLVGPSNARVNEPIEEDSDDSVDCEDFSDSEYDLNSVDEEDVVGDNTLFENHVDAREEWAGNIPDDNVAENATDDESEGVVVSDSEDFDSEMGSEEDEPRFPVFSIQDTYDPRFELGMYFTTKTEFRIAIHSHAVQTKRNLKINKNDLRRIYAKCGEEGCEWRCHALALGEQSCFQIREYHSVHRCGTSYHVKNCSPSWLGGEYEWAFRSDPRRNVKGFRLDIVREMNVHVSRNQAYRAKWNDRFGKLYTCFKGLTDGFLVGCRPIIGVDGCHLKGPHGGVLLCAVGIDPNNCIFPFAGGCG